MPLSMQAFHAHGSTTATDASTTKLANIGIIKSLWLIMNPVLERQKKGSVLT
jgi:hypothetical protein